MAEVNNPELFSQETLDLTTVLPTLEIYTLHCIARRFLIQQRFNDQCGVRGGAIARKGGLAFVESNSSCCFTKSGCWLMPSTIDRSERSPGLLLAEGYRTS